jgi:hypothetical protein
MANWMKWAGTAMQVSGFLQGAKGSKSEARARDRAAAAAQATSQRAAIQEKRRGRFAQSRAIAVAAASGAGASDPTVQNLVAGLEEESEYSKLTALYEGSEQAAGIRAGASAARAGASANYLRAGSSLLTGYADLRSKYG